MIIVDTSGLLAALDGSEENHVRAARAIREAPGPRLLSPFVLAELDYLLGRRVGAIAAKTLLAEVVRGAYQLEEFGVDDVAAAIGVLDRYPGLDLGLADASIVVLAERHGVRQLLTLDERHFRAIKGPRGRPFELLPADLAA